MLSFARALVLFHLSNLIFSLERPPGPLPLEEVFQLFIGKRTSPSTNLNRNVNSVEEFLKKRKTIIEMDNEKLLGHDMPLDEKEIKANRLILGLKYKEFDKSLNGDDIFPPSIHFFKAKLLIEQSEMFDVIKKIPKGANLYSFLLTSVDLDFMYELTFEKYLYFRFDDNLKFKYYKNRREHGWRLLSQFRNTDKKDYTEDLNNSIKESLRLPDPNQEIQNEFIFLQKILNVLEVYIDLVTYKPNFVKLFKRALEILHNDNIMYAEFRYGFPDLYDLNGNIYNASGAMQICNELLEDFKKKHEDFVGVRFIYAPIRNGNQNYTLRHARESATALWREFPDLVVGFSVVRIEGLEEPLPLWAGELLKFPKEIKLFFDSGFTLNWGTDSDYNLLDALTFNAVAVGEGFSLNKHPAILEELRKKGVFVEFSPISAQAMRYIKDMRNHPLAMLVASDFPLVIGNGGGTLWNATGLSYDWYEVYMGMTPRFCDLRCLKQFAMNSWLYSNMPVKEKKANIIAWLVKWHDFVNYVINNYA